MSAESGKGVERFDCTSGGAQWCQGCYTMTPDSDGEYVRHEDYAELEQQRAALADRVNALVEALTRLLSVYAEPDRAMCCDGRECGCMGASVYQEAEHYARDALHAAGVATDGGLGGLL